MNNMLQIRGNFGTIRAQIGIFDFLLIVYRYCSITFADGNETGVL